MVDPSMRPFYDLAWAEERISHDALIMSGVCQRLMFCDNQRVRTHN
jgi:hypothetical protein